MILISKKELCNYAGISPETLRHYLDCGLITPSGVYGKQNRFSTDDLAEVMEIRKLRSYGFSLRQIKEFHSTISTIEEFRNVLFAQKAQLNQQLSEIHASLQNLDRRLNQHIPPYFEEKPYLHCKFPAIGAFYDGTDASVQKVQQLQTCFPHTWSAVRVSLDNDGPEACSMGLCLDCIPDVLAALPQIDPEQFVHLSPLRILMHKRTHALSSLTKEDFSPVLEYARAHNFKITSDIIGLILFQFTDNNGETVYQLSAGVSIE